MVEWAYDTLRDELEELTRMQLTTSSFAELSGIGTRTAYEISRNARASVGRDILNKMIHTLSWRMQRAVMPNDIIRFEWDEGWRPEYLPKVAPSVPTREDWARWVEAVEGSKNE